MTLQKGQDFVNRKRKQQIAPWEELVMQYVTDLSLRHTCRERTLKCAVRLATQ